MHDRVHRWRLEARGGAAGPVQEMAESRRNSLDCWVCRGRRGFAGVAPFLLGSDGAVPIRPPEAEEFSMAEAAGARSLLVVDDDAGLLRTLQILLEDEGGYRVVTASGVREALARLEQDPSIEAAIFDFALPDGDGVELLEEIRRRRIGIPVLVMTAHVNPRTRDAALSAGAQAFLTKPVDPDLLLGEISRGLTAFPG